MKRTIFLSTPLFLSLFVLLTFTSCQKSNSTTQAQINAARLRSAVGSTVITSVTVYNASNNVVLFQGNSISFFGDGFAAVSENNGGTEYYNLGLLRNYDMTSGSIDLYF